ncbi:very short patch repair endonuclease [Pseudomonas sp. PB3P13]
MVDIVDRSTRSRMMSGIRGKHTKPELILRHYLHARGLRYRLHRKNLPGQPDLTLPKYNLVIFVHGCFWHCHPNCSYATTPASNLEFWNEKLKGNFERDHRVAETLLSLGWRVLTVWECGLKHCGGDLDKVVDLVTSDLKSMCWPFSPPKPKK